MITGCAVAPAVLMATGLLVGKGKLWSLAESTRLNGSTNNLSQMIVLATPSAEPNLVQIRPRGHLYKYVKYNKNLNDL